MTEEPLLPPPDGWELADFPAITTDLIPYTSNVQIRADPRIAITPEGWMYIEVGNVRIAISDREEWHKLVTMGEASWNSYQIKNLLKGEPDNGHSIDDSGAGLPSRDNQPDSCGDPASEEKADSQSD